MEHYYVITGNEFGVNIDSKKNFMTLEEADLYFEKVQFEDFGCLLMRVRPDGSEEEIKCRTDDD